ncbi:RloB family protein [Corynebacterium sp. HMSC068G04]|uniref:RloB family protein n=1 Tax=Corynebacterium sp. HMSC068G04 TaxID=1739497 RepID=UPI0008A58F58|nr:RloB family protein [Corynebacterium sp. HMSC068G04]OFP31090.1 hypothetical protein HMPREF2993_01430 [Corynebacterium sp. HMSC068G04]
MARTPKPSGKKGGRRLHSNRKKKEEIKNRYLIVTEGLKTEPSYFDGLKRTLGPDVNFHIEVKPRIDKAKNWTSTPTAVVDKCIELKKADAQKCGNSKKHPDKLPYVKCFAVIDVDHWNTPPQQGKSNLNKALETANKNNISVAISNTKFEAWLLWHVERKITCHDTQLARLCQDHNLLLEKEIPPTFPYSNFKNAAQNADNQNRVSLNQVGIYPSTSVPRLLEEIGII